MTEKLGSGEEILTHLKERYLWYGRLSTHTTADEDGGPLLRIFYKHSPDCELAAPGTHFQGEEKDVAADSWRVRMYPRLTRPSEEFGAYVVQLPDIITSLPSDLAAWALQAHESLVEAAGDGAPELGEELEEARGVTNELPVPEGHRRFHL